MLYLVQLDWFILILTLIIFIEYSIIFMPQELINSYLGCCTLPCRDNKLIGLSRYYAAEHTRPHSRSPWNAARWSGAPWRPSGSSSLPLESHSHRSGLALLRTSSMKNSAWWTRPPTDTNILWVFAVDLKIASWLESWLPTFFPLVQITPPVAVKVNFTFFEVTNPDDVSSGRNKPNLQGDHWSLTKY